MPGSAATFPTRGSAAILSRSVATLSWIGRYIPDTRVGWDIARVPRGAEWGGVDHGRARGSYNLLGSVRECGDAKAQ